jgi:hypothetical protein
MSKTRQPKVSLYWDCQNVPIKNPYLAQYLLIFANQLGELRIRPQAYSYWRKEKPESQKRLYEIGFQCIDVPVIEKNAVDKRMIDDCQQEIKDPLGSEIVILVTGDGDFTPLVAILQTHNKIVKVFAQANIASSLISKVGKENCYDVNNLPELVDINQEITSISYDDAIACLIEAINIALSKGKRTALSHINNLMCDRPNFPNYQGVSSIQKPDGSTFSKFSKFIAAVANEGKVMMKGQGNDREVFLIE